MTSVKEAADRAGTYASDKLSAANEKLHVAGAQVRDKASAARDAVTDAAGKAKVGAARARSKTAEEIQDNPIVALIGGVAIGAIAGALLPRTRKEAELLGPLGGKIADAAKAAATAARDAGQQALDDVGINRDAAKSQIGKLFDQAVEAASTAGAAAAKAAKDAATESSARP